MAVFLSPRVKPADQVQWLHRLFVNQGLFLSCDVDAGRDGTFAATLFPLWAPENHVTELLTSAADATRWHAEMTQRLQSAGWLLVEGRAVTSAA